MPRCRPSLHCCPLLLQKLTQYNDAVKLYELYFNQLLTEQAAELDKIIKNVSTLINKIDKIIKINKMSVL